MDDGKSTLIGRLLYDSKMIFEDQLAQLKIDTKKLNTRKKIDFALVDGLEVERQQGITIDVAYRFFTTEKRKFIVVDTQDMNNILETWLRSLDLNLRLFLLMPKKVF